MRRELWLAAALWLAGCGYVGSPLPPALNIPMQVTDLRGLQRGGKIYVALTPPMKTTDNMVLKEPPEIELRAGVNPASDFEIYRWATEAKLIPVPQVNPAGIEVAIPSAEWAGKEIVVAARAIGPTKRASQWSNLLVLKVAPEPAAPTDFTVTGDVKGAWLQWKGQGTQFRVWRLTEGDKDPAMLGVSGEPSWLDGTVVLGKSYTFVVQQIVGEGDHPAESEMSKPVQYKHADVFPPAVPAGLTAITGVNAVELNWDRNTEADLKSYQVYRSLGDGPMVKLGEPTANPSYSDTKTESGKKYRYAVAAVDEAGNESQPCAAVEVTAP